MPVFTDFVNTSIDIPADFCYSSANRPSLIGTGLEPRASLVTSGVGSLNGSF